MFKNLNEKDKKKIYSLLTLAVICGIALIAMSGLEDKAISSKDEVNNKITQEELSNESSKATLEEKLKNIYNDGHEIGNHSYIHPNFVNITEERMNDELQKTEDIIYETIGCNTKLFRFPSGSYNEKALNYVLSKGYKCIQWDVDSVDWKQSGADVEYNRD